VRIFKLDGLKPSSLIEHMSKARKTVLEILFPQVRAAILRALFRTPLKQRYVRELVVITGLAMHTVQDELRKLAAIGVVKSWSNGYHRFYAADDRHPLFPHLLEIIRLSAKLPSTAHAALRRPIGRKRPRRRVPPRRLRPDRQPNWGLFQR
jgi:hypothetical protein